MRIIGGFYRSRPLKMVPLDSTRETVDKVRGAIFNIINPYFHGGTVLDLFAGSGSMGLEAISRGAERAYFNDINNQAYQIIKENIASLKLEKSTFVYKSDYKKTLETLKNQQFDVVFLDPPYKLMVYDEIISFLLEHNMLKNGSLIVIEYAKEGTISPQNLKIIKEKEYGIRKVSVLLKEDL